MGVIFRPVEEHKNFSENEAAGKKEKLVGFLTSFKDAYSYDYNLSQDFVEDDRTDKSKLMGRVNFYAGILNLLKALQVSGLISEEEGREYISEEINYLQFHGLKRDVNIAESIEQNNTEEDLKKNTGQIGTKSATADKNNDREHRADYK